MQATLLHIKSAGEKSRGGTLPVSLRLFSLKFAKNIIDKCGQ
jgi:hypothetical protein